ncbi:hypothetical protein DFJ73DRAFT_815262 [Zopfochytrium polystomum]|nr:hypothetical protein DFJ73DRAFT_815262 [Zopfochytrium polystomum]
MKSRANPDSLPHRHLAGTGLALQALVVALVLLLGFWSSETSTVSASNLSKRSDLHGRTAAYHRRDLDANIAAGTLDAAPAIYRRQKKTPSPKAAAAKSAGLAKSAAASADPAAKQKIQEERAARRKQASETKKAGAGAKADRTAAHKQRVDAKVAHKKAAAALKTEMDADPSVKDKWKNFKDHVVPFDPSNPTYGGHHYTPSAIKAVDSGPYSIQSASEKSAVAQIEFQGPHKNPKQAAKGKKQNFKKSVFLSPGDHSAAHPDLPNLNQEEGWSKKQVKSAALQAFVQGRASGTSDATVEVSGKGSVPMKVFASGGGPGTTYPDTSKL